MLTVTFVTVDASIPVGKVNGISAWFPVAVGSGMTAVAMMASEAENGDAVRMGTSEATPATLSQAKVSLVT